MDKQLRKKMTLRWKKGTAYRMLETCNLRTGRSDFDVVKARPCIPKRTKKWNKDRRHVMFFDEINPRWHELAKRYVMRKPTKLDLALAGLIKPKR